MQASEPAPVKYFIGALYSDADLLARACREVSADIGAIGLESQAYPFSETHYYDAEMGTPIYRLFWAVESLMDPGQLPHFKHICNAVENKLRVAGKRKVNLDIGYLDLHKVVLASAKYNGQKIYLSQGIYADLTLVFERGQFRAVDNTFPDFKSGRYDAVFMEMRQDYKRQLRSLAASQPT